MVMFYIDKYVRKAIIETAKKIWLTLSNLNNLAKLQWQLLFARREADGGREKQ
jgi:hypothetical protein